MGTAEKTPLSDRLRNTDPPYDDRVMGGVSRSALRLDPVGHAMFSGQVAPDNNRGFALAIQAIWVRRE